jgi:hypothetical protein
MWVCEQHRMGCTVARDSTAILRDGDIRWPLQAWLEQKYGHDGSSGIIHELEIPRPSGRVDLAVINGEMVGFEIKSDADTLCRLPRQTASFCAVFNKMYFVTTNTHLREARAKIPRWWGLLIARKEDDFVSFRSLRKSKLNKNVSNASLVSLLSRDELITFIKINGPIRKVRELRKSALQSYIISEYDSACISEGVKRIIRTRCESIQV